MKSWHSHICGLSDTMLTMALNTSITLAVLAGIAGWAMTRVSDVPLEATIVLTLSLGLNGTVFGLSAVLITLKSRLVDKKTFKIQTKSKRG